MRAPWPSQAPGAATTRTCPLTSTLTSLTRFFTTTRGRQPCECFVDTGAFFALIASDDVHHARATALFEQAGSEAWDLVTTNVVVAETHALLVSRLRGDRRHALGFLQFLDEDGYEVVTVTAGDHAAAVALLRSHTDKTYSLCDALSFVVMDRLGVSRAIAFDRHFRQYGHFNVL